MSNEAIFNVGQKAFIEKDGKVLVVWNEHGLDFPGGRIKDDELASGKCNDLVESLKREVREETGLEIEVSNPFATWFYKNKKTVFLVGYMCKWISGEVQLSGEHHKYEWVSKQDCDKINDNSEYFLALKKYFN